ncbi:MAG: type 2 lanthipeptide synthetase LanM family protein [Pseudomonadota bacterium]
MSGSSLTAIELSALAASGATLAERFSGLVAPAQTGDSEAGQRALAEWKRAASDNDDAHFAAVLAEYGVDESRALALLGPVRLASGETLPPWAQVFAQCFEVLSCPVGGDWTTPDPDDAERLRWSGLFHPLARAASLWRNNRRPGAANSLLSAQAAEDLERALVERLCTYLSGPLDEALRVHRFFEDGAFTGGGFPTHEPGRGSGAIQSFIPVLRAGGLKRFFGQRPVLARLTSTIVSQWIEATGEFLERLDQDMPGPVAVLASNRRSPRRVERIEAGLSDAHRGGRTVYKVSFDTGITLAYKPKSLASDCAFHRLLAWLSDRGAPPSAGQVRTIDRGSYGWAAWATAMPCQSSQQVDSFFRRSGAFLCLLRVLRSTDFHHENVVAVGAQPVPVDLETIVQPELPIAAGSFRGAQVTAVRDAFWSESVARTGYLPTWATLPGGGAVMLGGLDAEHVRIEGDRPSGSVGAHGVQAQNLPIFQGQRASFVDHGDALLAGYRAMFGFLRTHGREMLAPGGPLQEWDRVKVRHIARPTQQYALLEKRCLAAPATRDGARWSLHFDHLCRLSKTPNRDLPVAQLIADEREALTRFDVPVFTADAGGREITTCNGTTIGNFFAASAIEAIAHGFDRLDDQALAQDTHFIGQAIASCRMSEPLPWAVVRPPATSDDQDENHKRLCETERCKAVAARLAATLQGCAVPTGDATIWFGRTFLATDERAQQFAPIGKGYLSGTVGVALFLAAAARVERREAVRQALLNDVDDALWWSDHLWRYERMLSRSDQHTDIGIAHGLGGTLYGLVAIGTLTGKRTLFDRAAQIATWLHPDTIAADRNYSVFGGAAGLALGLAAVDAVHPGAVAKQISACRALLLDRSVDRGGCHTWPRSLREEPMAGLMQGPAGVALALARLPDPDGRSRRVIEGALAHEREAERQSDRPARGADGAGEAASRTLDYCNGRAGRLLAYAEVHRALHLGDRAAAAGRKTAAQLIGTLPQTDDLNHGTAGLVCAHLAAAACGFSETRHGAEALAAALDNYDAHGRLRWANGEATDNPGLANGVAGLGLVLLHAAEPDAIANYPGFPLPLMV